jgi:hypothetical protein
MFAARPAMGYGVGPAVPLDGLAKSATLIVKATVVGEQAVTDPWFDKLMGFEVRETELRVVSVIKGPAEKVVRFRHYASVPGPRGGYAPQSYELTPGVTYIVFARKAGSGYRQIEKSHSMKADQGVYLAANDKPHRGATVREAVWAELQGLLANSAEADVVYAIAQLNEMSGGRDLKLDDFDRTKALDAIRPMIVSTSVAIATAAIGVFGEDSQYFDDRQAPFWLAGIGKGSIPGMGARKPPAAPVADLAVTELVAVADGSANPELRALAIRAIGRSHAVPPAKIETWSRDANPAVRRAAVVVSAELADRKPIVRAAADPQAEVRAAAARAIGFAQDASLLPLIDKLLGDADGAVREAAAMTVMSFALDQAAPVMTKHLAGDYRALFVPALAHRDPKPYLAMLGEIIVKQPRPANWWGGTIPEAEAWSILFSYVKAQSDLSALGASLDALERMHWYTSSEPLNLYAFYLTRKLTARAKQFRAAVKQAGPFDMEHDFDEADKDPSRF